MINGLTAATISQYGLVGESTARARHEASSLFTKVLFQARQRNFWQRLIGRENRLQSLNSLAAIGERRPAKQKSAVTIPLANVVGSEARTDDFDSHFCPLHTHNQERWIGIAAARRLGIPLPPIEVIQAGDAYFVRDGHHRVSVARAVGQAEIEAHILYVIQ